MEKRPPLGITQSLTMISSRIRVIRHSEEGLVHRDLFGVRLLYEIFGNVDPQQRKHTLEINCIKDLLRRIDSTRKFVIAAGVEERLSEDDHLPYKAIRLAEDDTAVSLLADVTSHGMYEGDIIRGVHLDFEYRDPHVYCWFSMLVNKTASVEIRDGNNPISKSLPPYKANLRMSQISPEEHGVVSYCIDKINNLIKAYKNPDKKTQ